MGLKDLRHIINELRGDLNQLEDKTDSLVTQTEQLAQEGYTLLKQAHVTLDIMASDQQTAHKTLELTEKQTDRSATHVENLTHSLDEQMAEAYRLLDEIGQLKATHVDIDVLLDAKLSALDQTSNAVQQLGHEWQKVSQEISRGRGQPYYEPQEIETRVDLTSNFSVSNNLIDRSFEALPEGLEIFFANEVERRVTIVGRQLSEAKDQLLKAIEIIDPFEDGYTIDKKPKDKSEIQPPAHQPSSISDRPTQRESE